MNNSEYGHFSGSANDRLGDEYRKYGTRELLGDKFSSLPRLTGLLTFLTFLEYPLKYVQTLL